MSTTTTAAARRIGFGRSGVRRGIRTAALTLPLAAVLALTAGCGSGSGGSSSEVVNKLGAVPIPSVPSGQLTPTADESHPQLVAIGSAVSVTLPTGSGVITALGPTEDLPTPAPAKPPTEVPGTITLKLTAKSGTLKLRTADLSSRDDHGNEVKLSAVDADQATVNAGGTATLVVRGTFQAGAAQVSLQQDGHLVAMWDFTIELD